MNPKLKEKITESVAAVLPITLIVLCISIFLTPMDLGNIALFFTGACLLVVGMSLFQLGSEMAMTPLGEGIGVQLSKTKKTVLLILLTFLMGLIITLSEPDLAVLAEQVPAIPNLILILVVSVGVGVFLSVAVIRIRKQISLSVILIALYVLALILSVFVPKNFFAVAFDSGGVTTGPMTVPFIMAMGVGLASVRSDKNAASDSFGLVALSSIGPIIAVLFLGLFFRPDDTDFALDAIPVLNNTRQVAKEFFSRIDFYAEEVAASLLPLVAVFLLFQFLTRRYHKRQFWRVVIGFFFTFFGLALFLCGVGVGFAPVGELLGETLAAGPYKWLLIPIGALIGYFIVKAEPAIQVLNAQVENVTDGMVSIKAMNRAMSIGVASSVALSILRTLLGIPVQFILIPGYVLALTLSFFVPKMFVGIAFDSGGVASGPMTSTFLIPLSIGVCASVGGDIMSDAFGVVALVALTPLIAIQIMGLSYQLRLREREKLILEPTVPTLPADCDVIIDLEEVSA